MEMRRADAKVKRYTGTITLLFMGQDFAQTAEWNEAKSLDW